MRKMLSSCFLFCVAFFCAHTQPVLFKSYTVHEGLVANPVRCVYQDKMGFIWIGTFEGLSRYDGHRFTNYTNSNGLSHNFINSVFEIDNKVLIAENNGAIDAIENNRIQKGPVLKSAVNYIMPYKDRLLLSTDSNGFYEYKHGKIVKPVQDKMGLALGHFVEYNDSLLVADGIDDNLFIFSKDLSLYASLKNSLTYYYSVVKDSKNNIWACTSTGLRLLKLPAKKNQPISFAPLPSLFNFNLLKNSAVTSMIEEPGGGYWIGTMQGLIHLFPNGNFQIYNEKDGLPSAAISTIYRDREKNLWIGTALGLAKWVSKNNIVFYNTPNRDFKNDIVNMHLLPGGKILLNSGHGLQQFDFQTQEFNDVETAFLKNGVPVDGSSPLLVHHSDQFGLYDAEKNTISPLYKINTLVPLVFTAYKHPSGLIFLGANTGLFVVNKSSVQKLLPHRITCMIVDVAGYLWVGSWMNGLYRVGIKSSRDSIAYDVQDFTSLVESREIRGLFRDSKKNTWVGTRYAGAFCLSPKENGRYEKKHFNRRSGLMSDWIRCFGETSGGDIWIGTYLGLDRLVKQPGGYRIFNFSKTINFFGQIQNIVPAGNDSWICVANTGIAYFKDEAIHQSPPLQPLILSASLGVRESKLTILSPKEKVILDPHQNAARFEFSALGFVNEKQVLFSYRLKGSGDSTWSQAENIHEASYVSLSPGSYTFEVRTIGWNGKDSLPASFSFVISMPFWKQAWFIGLCFVIVALVFYSLYKYRLRQLIRVQKVRNRIASDLHDDIGSTLTNISILSELSSNNLAQPEKVQPFLQRISEEVQSSSQAMDDIIWSVNSHNDSLQETMARMRRYTAELFDNSEVSCHMQIDDETGYKKLSMEQRRDVYLIYKESLNNIRKHANASNVWIEVRQNHNHLFIQIRDDGKGFNTTLVTGRNGLKNMRSRVEKWKGKMLVTSGTNSGTIIEIQIPLKD